MLKSRVITALILAVVALTAVFALPPTAMTLLLALVVLGIGGWESASLAGLQATAWRVFWVIGLFATGVGLVWLSHDRTAIGLVFGLATIFWIGLVFWLCAPLAGRVDPPGFQPFKLVIAGTIVLATFIALAWLHFFDPWWIVSLIVLIAAADIGAYFAGRSFGGPKLAPRISPGKTRSGAVGGIVAAAIVGSLTSLLPTIPYPWWLGLAAGAGLGLLSIGGDLVVSLMKRHRGMKDTSNLLPGHGGLLDRMDSLGAAAPAYALLIWYFARGAA